jgi:predicted transcriptional regulator of viral defense system
MAFVPVVNNRRIRWTSAKRVRRSRPTKPADELGQNVLVHATIPNVPGRAYEVLFDLATDQRGYVTQEQARQHGLTPYTLVKMAERGQVKHIAQGLYRFKAFPPGPLDTYMEAVLWPRGVLGVLCHETALDLYDLSDVNPAKIHLTVPADHRIRRKIPDVYEIHHADLTEDDRTWREGLPVTTVERTIRDCHRAHLRGGLLAQALDQARTRGLITAATARELRREIASPAGAGRLSE